MVYDFYCNCDFDKEFLVKRYRPYEVQLKFTFAEDVYLDNLMGFISNSFSLNSFYHSTDFPSLKYLKNAEIRKSKKFNYFSKCRFFLISLEINKKEKTFTFTVWNKLKTPISNISKTLINNTNSLYQYASFYYFNRKNLKGPCHPKFSSDYKRHTKVSVFYTNDTEFKVNNLF